MHTIYHWNVLKLNSMNNDICINVFCWWYIWVVCSSLPLYWFRIASYRCGKTLSLHLYHQTCYFSLLDHNQSCSQCGLNEINLFIRKMFVNQVTKPSCWYWKERKTANTVGKVVSRKCLFSELGILHLLWTTMHVTLWENRYSHKQN